MKETISLIYQHELEAHMVVPGTVIAIEGNTASYNVGLSARILRQLFPHQQSTDSKDPPNWPSWLSVRCCLLPVFCLPRNLLF
jgi:hypothetical protein